MALARSRQFLLAAIFVASLTHHANAFDRAMVEECKSTNPETSIKGCSKIILAPRAKPQAKGGAYLIRGIRYLGKRDFEAALLDADLAVTLLPKSGGALALRAFAALQAGKPERVVNDLNRALTIDPRNKVALRLRSRLLELRGDTALAIRDSERFIALLSDGDTERAASLDRLADLERERSIGKSKDDTPSKSGFVVAIINGESLLAAEVADRVKLLSVRPNLRPYGAPEAMAASIRRTALDDLVGELLVIQIAAVLGIAPTDREVSDGIVKYSKPSQLASASASARRLIRANLAWRNVMNAKFKRDITAELDDPASNVTEARTIARSLLGDLRNEANMEFR